MPVTVQAFDHLVFNVADPARSCEWYCENLGLAPLRLAEFKAGEVFFPSARVDPGTIIDFMPAERGSANVDHICLVIDEVDLDALAGSGEFEVLSGPSEVFGARGMGRSVYIKDPDGNTVELRVY